MMAPDSHKVRDVFGSVMAGTRPLGLRDSKGSVCFWEVVRGGCLAVLFCFWGCAWLGGGKFVCLRTFLEIGEIHDFGLVGDVELVEDDGYFPWVGSLVLWLDDLFDCSEK